LTYSALLIDTKDEEGNFPLGIAAQSGFVDVVTLLIQKGANINMQNVIIFFMITF